MQYSHSFLVDKTDIDEQGHANNVAYLRWIQDIAVAHWRHAATREMIKSYSWVVVRHEIDYKKPAFAGEEITATTWVGKWTRISCERFTEIRRRDVILARGRTVWCMVDREFLRPARIGKTLIEQFT